ncbi:hypothetical protein L596_028421 [Steinernema carpocapsae]|uniref:CUB-like domain-containing protein n=1 Tax=Steinernema carpocapsae TaxID=34508 RepID=A0A4U5LYE6_STECR|nr:hypothetical protein L596_028421 [Steinernema carpocapsae]
MRLLAAFIVFGLCVAQGSTKVVDAVCGDGSVPTLEANSIIRFSSLGFGSDPYPKTGCTSQLNLTINAFFIFEHINLAVQDWIQINGDPNSIISGSQWSYNSNWSYPALQQGADDSSQGISPAVVNFVLNVTSTYQTAGFRMWVYPYKGGNQPAPPCDDEKICAESQMFFSLGFPYNHTATENSNRSMTVNSKAYRYAATSAFLSKNTKTNMTFGTSSLRGPSDTIVNSPNVGFGGGAQSCYNPSSGPIGVTPAKMSIVFQRAQGTNDYFLMAVESYNYLQNGTVNQIQPITFTENDVFQVQTRMTNAPGTLYRRCANDAFSIELDPSLNATDYSMAVWMEYFDSENGDSMGIQVSVSNEFGGLAEMLIQKILHGINLQGPIVDPNRQWYRNELLPIYDIRYTNLAFAQYTYTFTSDAAISGAGGLFHAMIFSKKPASQEKNITGVHYENSVGFPYGYSAGCQSNITYYPEEGQILMFCLEEFGMTFTGFETTQARLSLYEGTEATSDGYIHSYQHIDDTKFKCTRTTKPGNPLLVIFESPKEFIPADNIPTLKAIPGMPQFKLNFPIPIFFGGRMTDRVKYDDDKGILDVPSDKRLGFRYSIRNAPYFTPPPIVISSAFSARFSVIPLISSVLVVLMR